MLDGVPVVVAHIAGWNQLAGVYVMGAARSRRELLERTGSGSRHGVRGRISRCARSALPAKGVFLGEIECGGRLLVADAWSPADPDARVLVPVAPGPFVIERLRIDCPWDAAVNARMGIQAIAVRSA